MMSFRASLCAGLALAANGLPAETEGDYKDVGMQCVSEFNWNQGLGATYKSATGYFIGKGGRIETTDIPDCAGGWSAEGDTLTLKGNKQPRMFLKDADDKLIMLDMKSEEVSWTQNVAQLGRRFNGALYTTWVRPEDKSDPATAARLYCDANDGTGNNLWCPEMDLGEANACGFRSTSHPVTDLNGNDWTSNAVNCHAPLVEDWGSWFNKSSSKWVQNLDKTNLFYCGLSNKGAQNKGAQQWADHFGNGLYFTSAPAFHKCKIGNSDNHTKCDYGNGETIDTKLDYDVNIKFDWAAEGYLAGFRTTLTQGSKTVMLPRQTTPNPASVPIKGGFPNDGGMAILVQLWTSAGDGMSWLSGKTCNYTNGQTDGFPATSDTTYTMKNIRIKTAGFERKIIFKTYPSSERIVV